MGLGEAMMICGKKDGEILYMEPSLPTISLQIGKERAATRASTGRQEHPSSEVTLGRNQLTANSHAGGGGGERSKWHLVFSGGFMHANSSSHRTSPGRRLPT